uniref:AMP-dependent synthetase/ligase domain-containing protein n=1 Tax=Oryza barthii TaxID=65489 RepID=A0A0D3ENF0_9ORYZ
MAASLELQTPVAAAAALLLSTASSTISMEGTVLCSANHAPLTPISFLERTALVYPDRLAIVASDGSAGVAVSRTWRDTRARCLRLAAALTGRLGVQRHDVVAVFAQNIPAVCELHFGVPMAGAVICTLNSRLDAAMAAVLLRHSEAKVVFVDRALLGVAQKALVLVAEAGARRPVLVLISELLDENERSPPDAKIKVTRVDYEYEHLLSAADPARYPPRPVEDEWDAARTHRDSWVWEKQALNRVTQS